ncbi:FtsH protease activity modulator HflK [Candidatus Methylopumilus universalis]|jgi:membrane protease subunit HflK|uniref:Protein HflK n=1 Tax=Candidatus Methylopumilus universalis TaxID=2588536 RepID=A0AAX1EZG1_9PROT|nr:FtsH protease activity modulator HflK [Candidatus Methylopumilus universalis]MBW0156033.1 FtsH protease activity modulator HflK [Candidatus Methylopumilus sp.]QDC41208.1 FtsH protease activity modulator HflK [Candidatus Methylopumilus universalis]QDC42498.1 FtsH protease activity modulator HflK [Candidatus Methylopumilus universalis]QDC46188.1 FtsH protease activity modulator HflK [Candidatus Methylopumilus universalis]QDC54884.1 FtsH protease activity modulator HflK [Candidatus Methylopumi
MAKNPGQNNNQEEGPPDLDELLNDLRKKIGRIFGKKETDQKTPKSSGGNPTPNSGNDQLPLVPILLIVVLLWAATGFYIVDQGSRGVVLRFGKNTEVTMPGPRWHIPYPIESAEVVNLEQVRTIEVGYRSAGDAAARSKELRESLMLTDDENIIDLQFAVQYNLKSVEDFLFNNRSAESSVRGAAETAIREIVGKSKMDFALYEGREEIAVKAKKLMQEILDRYNTGINVTSVTMQNAQPPEQVQASFDDAVKAKQDLERQKNEGQAYANDIIPKAKGTASRLTAEAQGYRLRVENEAKGNASRFEQILTQYNRAPEVMRDRLYIEAQEQILSSVSKVFIDQKNSNNLLYLPLDKLIQQATPDTTSPRVDVIPQVDMNQSSLQNVERTRDAFKSREREVR